MAGDFFLDPAGSTSPEAELAATLRAWFDPVGSNPDAHPRCRFPARYFWLQRELGLGADETGGRAGGLACGRLDRWARLEALDSVSMVMISGYFGNPASSFGHILLRLNNGADTPGLSLLDLGINYGALVPENEATPIYVLRGLFGGYQAGFSDKLYYTQDLAYSRVEFRDMWEYELNLPPDQERLLVFHLWELVGRKFQYYFLRENCAYRMAELLELVTGEDYTGDAQLWYAPVTFFHHLADRNLESGGRLVQRVQFHPSSQRILYHQFAALPAADQDLANRLIGNPARLEDGALEGISTTRQQQLLEVLLAYYQYRLVALGPDADPAETLATRQQKDAVLRARLALPPAAPPDLGAIPALMPPAEGSKPSRFGLGGGVNGEFGGYALLTATPFSWDTIGNNNLGGSELVVLDLAAGYAAEEGLFLDRLDVIRARKANLNTARITGENQWSWQVALGIRREDRECTDCREAYGTAGLGRAFPLADALMVYGSLDGVLDSRGDQAWARPTLGLQLRADRDWVTQLELGYEKSLDGDTDRLAWRLDSRYSLDANHELRLGAAYQETAEISLSLQRSW